LSFLLFILIPIYLWLQKLVMGLLNQQGKKGDKKQNSKQQKNTGQSSKFIGKGSKAAGGGLNKKGLTGGSRGS
jgi:hypothetical protein